MRRVLLAIGAAGILGASGFGYVFLGGGGGSTQSLRHVARWGGRSSPRSSGAMPFSFTLGQAANGSAACTGADLIARYNGLDNPVTVTRSTAAWCTKGNETKDIANGDLVLIPANKPRWMPGGEGDGGMGVAVWAARTNYLLRSQEFDHADWRKVGCVAGVCADNTGITVTANAGVAPDGTMTADLVECGSSCYLEQDACPVDYVFRAAYVRLATALPDGGVPDSSDFIVGANLTTTTPVTSASWTRMVHDNQADNAAYFYFGHYNGTSLPATSFYVWQADCQRNSAGGVRATHPLPPPITTVAATVTTADEVVQVANYTPTWSSLSWSASFQPQNSPVDGVPITTGGTIDGVSLRTGARATCQNARGGVYDTIIGSVALATNTQTALACSYDGVSRLETCTGSACVDGGSDVPARQTTTTIGSEWNGLFYSAFANGVIKEIAVTSSSVRDIYLVGDSIVEGNGAGAGHQPQFIIHGQLGNAVAISNSGVSGYTIEQCATLWNATLSTIRTAGTASRSYMMVQCGTNSNAAPSDGGAAVSNVTSYLQSMLASGQDAGVHILWSTITPTSLTCASFIQPVNSAMTAWAASNGVTTADTFALLNVTDGGCALASAYDFGDALHLNDAGVNVETQAWISAGRWSP